MVDLLLPSRIRGSFFLQEFSFFSLRLLWVRVSVVVLRLVAVVVEFAELVADDFKKDRIRRLLLLLTGGGGGAAGLSEREYK